MKISVLVPAYNAAPFLDETLRAIFAQTRSPEEVVVLDDGSTDATAAVAQRWSDRVVFRRQENAGVSAARNATATAATGTHLLFVDADDQLLPRALETLAAPLAEKPAAVSYGWTRLGLEEESRDLRGKPDAQGLPPRGGIHSFWKSAITTPGAAIVPRALFNEVGGFPVGLEGAEDRAFWMKCGALAEFVFCDRQVIAKRVVPGSVSDQGDRNIYHYMLVQLEYLDWCRQRGISLAGLENANPLAIVDYSLRQAAFAGHWRAVSRMIAYARAHDLPTPLRDRMDIYRRFPAPIPALLCRLDQRFL